MSLELTASMGSDTCPKCGASDLARIYVAEGNAISLTCKVCTYKWELAAADTPVAPDPPPP